jgi:integrase
MPNPEKRDGKLTGFWYGEVDYRTKGGRRFKLRFETKREAEGYEAYVRATGEDPPWVGDLGAGHTFAGAAADCKAHHQPWLRGRDRSTHQRLEFLTTGWFGKLPLASITRETLKKLVGELRGRGDGGSTINRYLAVVSTVFSYAAKDEATYGKVTRPSIPRQDEGKRREETLSPEQENAICRVITEAGRPHVAFLVRVLSATGMRVGELRRLKPEQIEHDMIKLKAADTKTNAPRWVYVDPEMARELRAFVVSGAMPSQSHLWTTFKRAVRTCGYNGELTLHSLRHTRATCLLETGTRGEIVMQMMGWSSTATMKRYSHVNADMQREAAIKASHRRWEKPSEGAVVPFPPIDKAG